MTNTGVIVDYSNYLVFSLSLCLALLCIFQIVRITCSPTASCNQLTMWPYYLMLISQVFLMLFMTVMLFKPTELIYDLSKIFISFKLITENLAICVQTFEWLCLFNMINFQKKHRIETMEVEKRKFVLREERLRNAFICIIFILVLAALTSSVIWIVDKHRIIKFHLEAILALGIGVIMMLFFLVTVCLFFSEAHTNYRLEYKEHKRRYWIQATGMFVTIAVDIALNYLFYKFSKN
jgi:hypothetical protein